MDLQLFVEEAIQHSASQLVDDYLQENLPTILGEHLLDVCSPDVEETGLALENIVTNRVSRIIETVDIKNKALEKRIKTLEDAVISLQKSVVKLATPKLTWLQKFWKSF